MKGLVLIVVTACFLGAATCGCCPSDSILPDGLTDLALPDDCIGFAIPGYTVTARLIGADGCPFRGLEVSLRVMKEGAQDFAAPPSPTLIDSTGFDATPNFISSTDEHGDVRFAWASGPYSEFLPCVTEEELLALTPEGWWASPLSRVQFTFQASGRAQSVTMDVPEDHLQDFNPAHTNRLSFGTILVAGATACDRNEYADLDFVGFCELAICGESECPRSLEDEFCAGVRAGEIDNVEDYCPQLQEGEAPRYDEFCLLWSSRDPSRWDDYATTLSDWQANAEYARRYGIDRFMVAGTCGMGRVLFLSRYGGGWATARFYYDAADGHFLGYERWEYAESAFIPPCCGNTYWPERVECPEPVVTEVLYQNDS